MKIQFVCLLSSDCLQRRLPSENCCLHPSPCGCVRRSPPCGFLQSVHSILDSKGRAGAGRHNWRTGPARDGDAHGQLCTMHGFAGGAPSRSRMRAGTAPRRAHTRRGSLASELRRVCVSELRRVCVRPAAKASCVRAGPAFVCCAARIRSWYHVTLTQPTPSSSAHPRPLPRRSPIGAYGGQRQAHMPGHAQAASHASPARTAYGYGSAHQNQLQVAQTATQQQQQQAVASWQLDETVKHNKNLRDSMIVENWIRKSQLIMQKFKLSPLPDSLALDGSHSEAGTDYSTALTMEHDQVASAQCVAPAKCGAEQAPRYCFCLLPSCAIALSFVLF